MRTAKLFRSFLREEQGAALLEYGMLVALIAAICIVAVKSIGTKVSKGFTAVDALLP